MNLADRLISFVGRREEMRPVEIETTCPTCGADLVGADLYQRYRICPKCQYYFTVPARERVAQLVDVGTFKETNSHLVSADPLAFSDRLPYRRRLFEAQKRTGLPDAVVTGTGKVGGRDAVVAVMDFRFLGGSMGSVVGEKLALAFELAVRRRLPIVTVSTSGGARMQEGMLSLVQMAKTSAAAQRLHVAGLPFISVLTNPTTGGVYASFSNLGDIILAEPKALIGFAGPRVIEQTTHQKAPENTHTAEFLLAHGMIDRVVERPKLRDTLIMLLDLLCSRRRMVPERNPSHFEAAGDTAQRAWETVELARDENRPTAADYVDRLCSTFVELRGDRLHGDDPAIVAGLADLNGQPVAVVGQERGHGEDRSHRNHGRPRPEGFRKAIRVMDLAAKFDLPLLTFIDTPGADPGFESEARGLAMALAQCLAKLSVLPVPIVATIIGEGGSGGALALGVADRILMLEHAIYSVIGPEGAAAILYRDASRAPELARSLKLTAGDCKTLGVVDLVVPEPGEGAHLDHQQAAWNLKLMLAQELAVLQTRSRTALLRERYAKFRRMGEYGQYYREAVGRELAQLQEYVQRGLSGIREHLPHRLAEPPRTQPAALPGRTSAED